MAKIHSIRQNHQNFGTRCKTKEHNFSNPNKDHAELFQRLPKHLWDTDITLRYISNAIYKAGGSAVHAWSTLIKVEATLLTARKESVPEEEQKDLIGEDVILEIPNGMLLNILDLRKAMSITVKILGLVVVQVGQKRRLDLKALLDKDHHLLCDKTQPVKEFLFPTVLQKEIDNIITINKLAKKVSKKRKQQGKKHFCGTTCQHSNFLLGNQGRQDGFSK